MNSVSKRLIFVLLAIAQFMVVLDVSIVNVALPAIKQALGFSQQTLQWVISAYAIAFGGFLLLGGRAADLFGKRRVLLVGMIAFSVCSLLLGLAQNAGQLVLLRALQGLSAALMSPAALSIVIVTFHEGAQRNKAFGLWTTVATGGAALGLLLGGLLSQYLDWRWIFLVNVPAGLIDAALIWRFVPRHASTADHRHMDLSGAVLSTGGLMTLAFGISQAPVLGWWSPATWATLALAAALLGGFVWNEARSRQPLVPLRILKNRNLSGANLMMAPLYAAMMGNFFLLSLYVQTVLGYSPVATGLAFLPFPLVMGLTSSNVARFVTRYGFKRFLIIGPSLVALALAWLSRLPVDGVYWTDVLPSVVLMPLGMGLTFMPIVVAATSGVAPQNAGLASGLINTSQMMGGALGLALLSGLAASFGGGPGSTSRVLAVAGYRAAFGVAVGFVLFALFLAAVVIRKRTPQAATAPLSEVEGPAA